ncbi:Acyltransferase [Pirellulimonas nuda]|uniref:Acyltransferase n=1 Tax=Pirellulimonas nuda TaxID=2528009 RepID=A0A518DB27_9BACT|nr:1-acyl-sn-glycerol-3-phosphate acyltransferase [Pirellulimonas nuda]QDU88689.1 Acyltransferase [Pirellulimonas nuda]
MNTQPYQTPPKWWAPKLTPWWIGVSRQIRNRELRKQRFVNVEVRGVEHVRGALDRGAGVLITPNHSFHYDSYCLMRASDALRRPFFIMTAWQVFAMSGRFDRWSMQHAGCFSVNREATDLRAFRQATDILTHGPYPLVVFAEGDVFHTNDRVTPFREGAAAMALSAARKGSREVVCVPTAIKQWYVTDPLPSVRATVAALEARLLIRSPPDKQLVDRVYRIGEAVLALLEIEHLGAPQTGSVRQRREALVAALLDRLEGAQDVSRGEGDVPERVKLLRRKLIDARQNAAAAEDGPAQRSATAAMDDVQLVMRLYSYPNDYVRTQPSAERLAETIDKFEEDILEAELPSVRGDRRVVVEFGEPITAASDRSSRVSPAELTGKLHDSVQALLDRMNTQSPSPHVSA